MLPFLIAAGAVLAGAGGATVAKLAGWTGVGLAVDHRVKSERKKAESAIAAAEKKAGAHNKLVRAKVGDTWLVLTRSEWRELGAHVADPRYVPQKLRVGEKKVMELVKLGRIREAQRKGKK